jgi:hypothetical protein
MVTTVAIEADGALPKPTIGVLDGPPRIYFDFADVLAATRGTDASSDLVVRRVRVALHSAEPRVTRVVIDLVRPAPYRIDATGSTAARLIVLVGGGSPPAAPAGEAPIRARPGANSYMREIRELFARLEKVRPVLVSIDNRSQDPPAGLQAAAIELASIEHALARLKPPPRLATAHERLVQSCMLATQAVKAQMQALIGSGPAPGWTAASAAAGALLLLDRARADFGVTAVVGDR